MKKIYDDIDKQIFIYILLNIIDVCSTIIGLSIGLKESNPLGFTYTTISLKITSIIGLIMIKKGFNKKEKREHKIIYHFTKYAIILLNIFYTYIDTNNIFHLIKKMFGG